MQISDHRRDRFGDAVLAGELHRRFRLTRVGVEERAPEEFARHLGIEGEEIPNRLEAHAQVGVVGAAAHRRHRARIADPPQEEEHVAHDVPSRVGEERRRIADNRRTEARQQVEEQVAQSPVVGLGEDAEKMAHRGRSQALQEVGEQRDRILGHLRHRSHQMFEGFAARDSLGGAPKSERSLAVAPGLLLHPFGERHRLTQPAGGQKAAIGGVEALEDRRQESDLDLGAAGELEPGGCATAVEPSAELPRELEGRRFQGEISRPLWELEQRLESSGSLLVGRRGIDIFALEGAPQKGELLGRELASRCGRGGRLGRLGAAVPRRFADRPPELRRDGCGQRGVELDERLSTVRRARHFRELSEEPFTSGGSEARVQRGDSGGTLSVRRLAEVVGGRSERHGERGAAPVRELGRRAFRIEQELQELRGAPPRRDPGRERRRRERSDSEEPLHQAIRERSGDRQRRLLVGLDQRDRREVEVVHPQASEARRGKLLGERTGALDRPVVEGERGQEGLDLGRAHSRLEREARSPAPAQELRELERGRRHEAPVLPVERLAGRRELERSGRREETAETRARLGQALHRGRMSGRIGGERPPGDRQVAKEIREELLERRRGHPARLYAPRRAQCSGASDGYNPGVAKKGTRSSLGQTLTLVLQRRDWLLAKLFAAAGILLLGSALWYLWPYWQLSGHFVTLPSVQPSRLYARSFRLYPGQRLEADALTTRLVALHYVAAAEGELEPGRFRASASEVSVYRRRFPGPSADRGGDLLVVDFAAGRVVTVTRGERAVREAWLDPPLLATYYGEDLLERRPVPLVDISQGTVRAVLAAEDASFFEHPGISFTGILRAVWVNLRGSGVMQGGSTLTQQLVKNIYLTSERTMSRKLREALLAVMLEWRYSKEQILEAYLNQIFWGRSGSANLIGVGAAAAAYCGKQPAELSLAESALLAAMIRAPGSYHPVEDAEAARSRRDFILDRLVALKWATRDAAEAAKREPLPTPVPALSRRRAPYFAEAVAGEARRRFGVAELADGGYQLLSTLDADDQEQAERAVREGLDELTDKSERVRRKETPLQAALVSLDPATGAVRAWVGGRDFKTSQFDRAGTARRQAGSAFKPLVYATAFEEGVATPATLLEDAPLTLEAGGKSWSPMNDDDQFHGWVTARTAVEQSYNLPTIRLALATGLPKVVARAKALGLSANLKAVPSIAIGSFEVAPVELAVAYSAFANRGVRPKARLLDGVQSADGTPLASSENMSGVAVFSPQTAFLVTTLLEGVVNYGTARSMRSMGLADPVAGKTGTSNNRRDNWFVGFAPDRATAVWVGFDDDSPTPFSGSKAALPVWTKFMLAVRPNEGYARFTPPDGIRVVLIDPASGELATERCPEVLSEAFPAERVPQVVCHLHGSSRSLPIDPQARAEYEEQRKASGISGWLKRVFNRRPKSAEPPP